MPVPSLPTDSLYKFVALSGVTLAVVAVLWRVSSTRELDTLARERTQIEADSKHNALHASLITTYLEHINATNTIRNQMVADMAFDAGSSSVEDSSTSNNESELIPNDIVPDPGTAPSMGRESTYRNAIQVAEELMSSASRGMEDAAELQRTVTELKGRIQLLDQQYDRLKLEQYLAFGLLAIGAIIAICGFSLWYVRIQRYQDELLSRQVAVGGASG